jgi:hypothetical protein
MRRFCDFSCTWSGPAPDFACVFAAIRTITQTRCTAIHVLRAWRVYPLGGMPPHRPQARSIVAMGIRSGIFAPLIVAMGVASAACRGGAGNERGGGMRPSAPSASLAWSDGGGAVLAIGARAFPVPAGELRPGAAPAIDHDEAGTRFSYVTADDRVRVVHVVGGGIYAAPLGTAHAPKAPSLEAALGALFENAGERRMQLASDVRATLGEPGVVKLLVAAADVDAPEWTTTFAALPEPRAREVKAAVAVALQPGKPTTGLLRAVSLLSPTELAEALPVDALAARLGEAEVAITAPRAAAVLLRTLVGRDPARAAQVGCALAVPSEPTSARSVPRPDADLLTEAAALAVAHARAACAAPLFGRVLTETPCAPSVRCGPSGPLDGRTASKQDEPLCSPAELAAAVEKELARPPSDAGKSGTRAPLFAFAALALAPRAPDAGAGAASSAPLPPAFVLAHGRRRYALAQPEKPACDEATPGAPCRCDEATVRDTACRQAAPGLVRIGLCAFEIDDKLKRLANVSASPPP